MKTLNRLVRSGDTLSLARGSAAAFAVKLFGFGVAYGVQIFLARWLGTGEYGSFIWISNNAAIVATFCCLGLNSAVVRFIPEYLAARDWSRINGLLRTSRLMVLGSSVALALFLGILLWLLRVLGILEDAELYWLGLALVPAIALAELLAGTLRGYKRMTYALAPLAVVRPVLLVAGLVLLKTSFPDKPITAVTALLVSLVAFSLTLLVQLVSERFILPLDQRSHGGRRNETRRWLRVSLPLLFVSGFLTLLNRMDLLLIGAMASSSDVGIYNAAVKTTTLMGVILVSVNSIAAPIVAARYSSGGIDSLRVVVKVMAHAVFWPTLAAGVVLASLSQTILGFFGPEFLAAQTVLVVLAFAQLLNAATGSVGVMLNMTGHQDATAKVYGWSVVLNLVSVVIGYFLLGLLGVALAVACTLVTQNLWLRSLTIKHLKIDPSILGALNWGGRDVS